MNLRWKGAAAAALITVSTIAVVGIAIGDEDEHEEHDSRQGWSSLSRGVAPVANAQYKTECASCHMAYPPGLLPARSWERIMGTLDDHFGENAELAPKTRDALVKYLVQNSADRAAYRVSAKFDRSIAKGEAPLRISETTYFVRKHDEVPARMVTGNPKVGSFANCAACHGEAEKGKFNEHDVRIPGYGRFED
jgi:mono/diheme cytochrome c family protein